MNLQELKSQFVKEELGITEDFGTIMTFIDFGNVNYWFESDRQDASNVALGKNQKLEISLEGLKSFTEIFSNHVRFYYGHDAQHYSSLGFIRKVRDIFGKSRVFTKQIQKVRHHLTSQELPSNTRTILVDNKGIYIQIPKCNFDVEISVDVIRMIEKYDTICLFSGDADFVSLLRYVKAHRKKVIIIKGGNIVHQLKELADLVVNAQNIKKYIALIKQKPDITSGLADRTPVSTGR